MRQDMDGRDFRKTGGHRRQMLTYLPIAIAILVGLLVGAVVPMGVPGWHWAHDTATPVSDASAPIARDSATFTICGTGPRINCVVDGDTFWLDGTKIRIADIDTPEIHPSRCEREEQLGQAAKHRLLELLSAGPFELASADRDTDRYGRKLRIVSRNGASLGDSLVSEGLARRWDGRRHPWCE